ncbi:MAG: ELM1/GtrOC1 family putative glycosyltransferase [Candidatus Rickettsia vulgarisii]
MIYNKEDKVIYTNTQKSCGTNSQKSIRPFLKLAYAEGFEEDTERRTAAYSNVREDSSTGSTYKSPAEVEFQKRSNVWVLADSRIGNLNQAIALAETIGLSYESKTIAYNCLGKLPNYLLALSTLYIKNESLKLLKTDRFPDIIISSGRRTAALASYLRKKSGNKTKIIQIMNPNLPFQQFELVILPEHDKVNKDESNVIRITGALNNIQDKIVIGGIELQKNYPDLKKFISVIIGGNSKNYKFTNDDALELASILDNITKTQGYSLFISFSRRTPNHAKEIIKEKIGCHSSYDGNPVQYTCHAELNSTSNKFEPASKMTKNIIDSRLRGNSSTVIVYDPIDETTKPNPYFGMLTKADYIIATADSISMCSEAASTGKPLYIFCPDNFNSSKHLSFLQQLIKLGIARTLTNSITTLENYDYTPLNEVTRISNIITSKIWPKL